MSWMTHGRFRSLLRWRPSRPEVSTFAMEGMPTALQSGTVLMAVDVEPGTDGALIHFHADGELALARTFTLNDPARLVVDLPGI